MPEPPLVVWLPWGIGDVLLATSAIRAFKERNPETPIIFQTHTQAGIRLEYPRGSPAEMLMHNPDIAEVLDVTQGIGFPARKVRLTYAKFGGPSLDTPIQAHYWHNLGLEVTPGQRFDAYYWIKPSEVAFAQARLASDRPSIVLTPHTGWPGKAWRDDYWNDLINLLLRDGIEPVILAGPHLPGFTRRGVLNLTGILTLRDSAAILDVADYAVMTEGGLSNLRYALGRPGLLMTCATQVGVQIWTPPELTAELRRWIHGDTTRTNFAAEADAYFEVACEPCMWRRDHVKFNRSDVPPATLRGCPNGATLRDIKPEQVYRAMNAAWTERKVPA